MTSATTPIATASAARRRALLALLLFVPVPALGVGAWLHGPALGVAPAAGKAIAIFAKIWLVALPLVWSLWIDRVRPGLLPLRRDGLPWGLVSGAAIFAAILGGYLVLGRRWIDAAAMRETAIESGMGRRDVYLLGVVYWCIVNSLIEEVVWRWFTFRQCETLMPGRAAVVATGLCFTLHHIVALSAYFDWRITLLGSLGVFIGGVTWSTLYLKYRSLWPGYVSHICADIAIFLIGWWLIFG